MPGFAGSLDPLVKSQVLEQVDHIILNCAPFILTFHTALTGDYVNVK
jgi:hypothetical protein